MSHQARRELALAVGAPGQEVVLAPRHLAVVQRPGGLAGLATEEPPGGFGLVAVGQRGAGGDPVLTRLAAVALEPDVGAVLEAAVVRLGG